MKDQSGLMSAGFLLGATYRKVAGLLQHRLKEYEITPEQWSVLYHIVTTEGMIQKQIAAQTYKDKPTVTRILHQLESKGFIVRKEGQEDRRSYRIYSTEAGKALMEVTIPIEESITHEMVNCLGEDEHKQLISYLGKINQYFSNEYLD